MSFLRPLAIPLLAALAALGIAQPPVPTPGDDDPDRIKDAEAHYPVRVTDKTLTNPDALAALQKPGTVIFQDGFESPDALKSYFEVLGLDKGRVKLTADAAHAHSGAGALQLTAPANNGQAIGAGPSYWFGDEKHGGGLDRVYLRYYIRFADDYDQGNLNHTGGSLAATSGSSTWDGMGAAGIRPKGDDRFTAAFEPWRDWGRNVPPGAMHLYTYWPDMRRDTDGHFWGNMMVPAPEGRIVPKRATWYCFEQMILANTPGKADGEMAAWIDGRLYIHYTGFRWRTTDTVRLKRFNLAVYIHQAAKDNTVWYDDVVLSTGYVGPIKPVPAPTP